MLLTTKNVCRMFRICKRTLWRWVDAGTFPPPLRINHQVHRWHPAVIEAKLRPATMNPETPMNETTTANEPGLMTPLQVARLLNVSVRTLWRMCKREDCALPEPVRFNRKLVRWKTAEVSAWIEGLVSA